LSGCPSVTDSDVIKNDGEVEKFSSVIGKALF
jgi:hypothetical protein